MVFKNLCVLVLWIKVAVALEGLTRKYILNCKKVFNEPSISATVNVDFTANVFLKARSQSASWG